MRALLVRDGLGTKRKDISASASAASTLYPRNKISVQLICIIVWSMATVVFVPDRSQRKVQDFDTRDWSLYPPNVFRLRHQSYFC